MKKSNFTTGLAYTIVGIILLLAAILTDSRLGSLLFGFAGAGIGPGIYMICKYLYWNRPENKDRYAAHLEQEKIELNDELKVRLRERSGRYAYALGIITVSISLMGFSILGKLELIDFPKVMLLYLSAYLLFQILAGIMIYKHLLKKYE